MNLGCRDPLVSLTLVSYGGRVAGREDRVRRGVPVSALLHAPAELAPVITLLDAIRARHGAAAVRGITPGLVVHDPAGWLPATRLVDGSAVPELLAAAHRRWGGSR